MGYPILKGNPAVGVPAECYQWCVGLTLLVRIKRIISEKQLGNKREKKAVGGGGANVEGGGGMYLLSKGALDRGSEKKPLDARKN